MTVSFGANFTLEPTATILPWRIRIAPFSTMPSGVTREPRKTSVSAGGWANSRQAKTSSISRRRMFAMLPMVRVAGDLWGLNHGHCGPPAKNKTAEGYTAKNDGYPNQGRHGIVHEDKRSEEHTSELQSLRH